MSDIEDTKEDALSDNSYEEDDDNESEEESGEDAISILDEDLDNDLQFDDLEALEQDFTNNEKSSNRKNSITNESDYGNISNDELSEIDDDSVSDSDDDDDDHDYYNKRFEKLDDEITKNHIENYHALCKNHNYQEIATLSIVVRNDKQEIIDPNHKTMPILTKYEKARILGQRSKQINSGAPVFVKPKQSTFNGYLIALQELEEKKLPFIIRRPLPDGSSEYWKVSDLEYLHEIA